MHKNDQPRKAPLDALVGKLKIRRKGGILPILCLLVLLMLVSVVGWLSVWGVPDRALRAIEGSAARQGYYIHLGGVYLTPASGLGVRVEGFELRARPEDPTPFASLGDTHVVLPFSSLFTGEMIPKRARVSDIHVDFPVSDAPGEYLAMESEGITAGMDSEGNLQISEGVINIAGISVKILGHIKLDKEDEEAADDSPTTDEKPEEDAPPFDLAAELRGIQPYTDRVHRLLHEQDWREGDFPSVTFSPHIQNGNQEYEVEISVPKFDVDDFHFRKGYLHMDSKQGEVILDSVTLELEDPESSLKAKGAFRYEDNEVGLSIHSDIPFINIANHYAGKQLPGTSVELPAFFKKVKHGDGALPAIDIDCHVKLNKDYTPERIKFAGSVIQHELTIGESRIDKGEVIFNYNNGDFRLEQCLLAMPEGTISLTANSFNGAGKANFSSDIDHRALLRLAGEFTGKQPTLPEEIAIEGRTDLNVEVDLTMPLFRPGLSKWQEYAPDIQRVKASASVGALGAPGCHLDSPQLTALIEGIDQDSDGIPTNISKASLSLSSRNVQVESGTPARLSRVDIVCSAEDVELSDLAGDFPDIAFNKALVKVSVDGARVDTGADTPARLSQVVFECSAESAELDDLAGDPPDITLHNVLTSLKVGGAQYAGYYIADTNISLKDLDVLHPMVEWEDVLQNLDIKVKAGLVRHEKTDLGGAELELTYNAVEFAKNVPFKLTVIPAPAKQEAAEGQDSDAAGEGTPAPAGKPGKALVLEAVASWEEAGKLELTRIMTQTIDLRALGPILSHYGVETAGCDLPAEFNLGGNLKIDTATSTLQQADFSLDTPHFVRRATLVPGLRLANKSIDVELYTNGNLYREDGQLKYNVRATLIHSTGRLEAKIVGCGPQFTITGKNTIRVDQLDILIDYPDAHEIIRDFIFPEGSSCNVTGIETKIDLSDSDGGRRVKSKCNVEVKKAGYLICALEVQPDGSERLRTDMGEDPYTYLNSCFCTVDVDVSYGWHDPQGNLEKDSCIIKLSNVKMDFNNAPWIRRQKFKSTPGTSKLAGDLVKIDTEDCYIEIKNVRGTVYPAYAFGMFYPDLQGFMKDVIVPVPLDVDTKGCIFPYMDHCSKHFDGTIKASGGRGNKLRMFGTDIPLENFSGFVYLEKDAVLLDRLNASCWDGVLNAAVRIGFAGEHTSLDGQAVATCVNLKLLAAAYNSKQKDAQCRARIRFRAPTPETNALEAYGEIEVADGDLLSSGLFMPVTDLISDIPGYLSKLQKTIIRSNSSSGDSGVSGFIKGSIRGAGRGVDTATTWVPFSNYLSNYDLQDAKCQFTIKGGRFKTSNLVAEGTNLKIRGDLDINLNNMRMQGVMYPSLYSLTAGAVSLLSQYFIQINVDGPVSDFRWNFGLKKRRPGDEPAVNRASRPWRKRLRR